MGLHPDYAKGMPILLGEVARASIFLYKLLDSVLQGESAHLAPYRLAVM